MGDAWQGGVATLALLQQHHRPLARFEQRTLGIVHFRIRRNGSGIRQHDGEGLLLAILAATQARHGFGVRRIAGEVVAAEALDGDDLAATQARQGFGDGIVDDQQAALRVAQREARTTFRAGVRLRMETPIRRIVVFAPAVRTHGEGRHAGVRPVVGQVARQGVARAAVRAVDEGMAPAPVGGIEQLGEAVRAGGGIRRHRGIRRAVETDFYLEAAHVARRRFRRLHGRHAGQRRRFGLEPRDEILDRRHGALHLDVHALAVVAHPAGEVQFLRQAIDEGPEADALHLPAHADAAADDSLGAGGDGHVSSWRWRHRDPARRASRPCPRRSSTRPASPRSSD